MIDVAAGPRLPGPPRLRLVTALCAVLVGVLLATSRAASAAPSFGHAIVEERFGEPRLVVDGAPFFFWGGAFFYDRIEPARWRASMLAMRALGANTLDLYVPWNWHELADGTFDFDGHTDPRRNLRAVLRLGKELGFFFIVRPGPVIRNEWRNGGYPAWLLSRPEYDMPLHDVLEGRYPATATLQNARSDDAAAEWLRNRTHLRYASRWLHRALDEFRPVADRVLAVQLDDDQGAYIDNQTYPAPHLRRYLRWLERQVREVVGPLTPAFVNTYQMRAPWSSPVWTMGNWYQSDAYTVGTHDRVDLDFSTLLLSTNPRGPLAQSEFQAGWLAGPEDPAPRPADPSNTLLALDELVALGAQGVIDFPMQDTLAEPGWEAPFSNAFYGWDAAISLDDTGRPAPSSAGTLPRPDRWEPTAAFGALVSRLRPLLTSAHRVADVAVAYGEPPPRADSRPPAGSGAIVTRVRDELRRCTERGLTCALFDVRRPPRDLRSASGDVVIGPELARASAPGVLRALRAMLHRSHVHVTSSVPAARGSGTTRLVSPYGTLAIAANWTDRARDARFGTVTSTLAPHTVVMRASSLALAVLGTPDDRRRVSSDDCDLIAARVLGAEVLSFAPSPTEERRHGGEPSCTVHVGARGAAATSVVLRGRESLDLPGLTVRKPLVVGEVHRGVEPGRIRVGPRADLAVDDADGPAPRGEALAAVADALPELGASTVVLRNDRLRVFVDPRAGARAFGLQARSGPRSPRTVERTPRGEGWSPNAFDATGGWRDGLASPLPASPRDYIARYTHAYPAGTFNRAYGARIAASGSRAVVRFRYAMPDARPAGATFERVVSLEAGVARVAVDECLDVPSGVPVPPGQRAVVRSSLPLLSVPAPAGPHASVPPATGAAGAAAAVALDGLPRDRAVTLPREQTAVGEYRDGFAFVVAWPPGAVERAAWTPYRSTGTLALTLAPGWRRTVYSYAWAGDVAAARAFMEAERTWVAANPGPSAESRGEVAKRYTQSPQKRPSASSCGFESHLPQ